jgi:hypothetical protein
MADLSPELVTQRTATASVSYDAHHGDNAFSEVLWSTTTVGTNVTATKSVVANQKDIEVMTARIDAAADVKPV